MDCRHYLGGNSSTLFDSPHKCLAHSSMTEQEMAERERQRRELHKLTVSELLGLLKGRRIPIGANKRKDELIDRLLVQFSRLPSSHFFMFSPICFPQSYCSRLPQNLIGSLQKRDEVHHQSSRQECTFNQGSPKFYWSGSFPWTRVIVLAGTHALLLVTCPSIAEHLLPRWQQVTSANSCKVSY